MSFLKALFSERGDVSMMRLMSLITCCSAIGIAIAGINRPNVDYSGLSLLCGAFLGVAFTGKVMQKNTEVASKQSIEK